MDIEAVKYYIYKHLENAKLTSEQREQIKDLYVNKNNDLDAIVMLTNCIPRLVQERINELTTSNKKPMQGATLIKEAKGTEHA